jgi:hypothetical protein
MFNFRGLWAGLIAALGNERGQIPSTLTDNYDALLTTTLRAMQPRLYDNITRGNKLIGWLKEHGKMRKQDGGERVKVALMHALNSTADIYSSYGNLDTTPQDGITSAFFDWSQLAVSIAISRKEERQNSGSSRLLSLLETKTTQAEVSIRELLNNCLVAGRITASAADGRFLARVGRLDSGANGPLPLAALIDGTVARSVSIGNINGATYSFWRNQLNTSAATTWRGFFGECVALYNDCSKGAGGSPDLIIDDQRTWEQYWNGLSNQERYVVTDQRTIDILGGTDMLKFRGAVRVWDEVVPDVETNAEVVDAIGTFTLGTSFYINSQAMEWIVDSQTDFITTPFVHPVGQDARVAEILWMGAMGINNRRKLGVMKSIQRTLFTS